MAGAAFFGMALISGSKLVYILAGVRHVSYWWFLHYVEQYVLSPAFCFSEAHGFANSPHMRKLYGDSLRKDAGFTKVVKKVARRNARLLESQAGRHAPEIRRVVREVRGTFEKVYEDTAEVVEEFLAKCMPLSLYLNFVLTYSQRAQNCLKWYRIPSSSCSNHARSWLSRTSPLLPLLARADEKRVW
jgi:hypothetical protein